MNRLTYLLLIILFGVPLSGQDNSIQELKKQFSIAKNDTSKIDISIQLIKAFKSIDIDSSLFYHEQALQLAINIKDFKRIENTQIKIYTILIRSGEYLKLKYILDKYLAIGNALGNDKIIYKSLINLATLNWVLSNLDLTFKYLEEAMFYVKKSNNFFYKGPIYNVYGMLYGELGDKEKAYEYFLKSFETAEQLNETEDQIIVLNNLARSFINQNKYEKALSYSEKGIDLAKNTNLSSLTIYEFIISKKAESLIGLGQIHKGLLAIESALEMAIQNNHKRSIIVFNLTKADALFKLNKYDDAIKSAKIGIDISKKINYVKDQAKLCELLAKSYKAKENYSTTTFWLEEEKKVIKEITKRQKEKEVLKLEAKSILKSTKNENHILALKNQNQKMWIGLLICFGLILSFLIFYYSKKSNQKKLEKLRQKIAADLHDDVGGNLNNITRIAKGLEVEIQSSKTKEQINSLVKNSNAAMKNIVDVIWALDNDENELEHLIEKIESYLDIFRINNPDIEIHFNTNQINENIKLELNIKHHILMIFKEAINNIQKHTNPTSIKLSINKTSQQFEIIIYNSFKEKRNASNSHGRGLSNIRKRVNEINGHIEIEETQNSFSINIKF